MANAVVEPMPVMRNSMQEDDPDDGLLAECRLMLKFLRETGVALPSDLAGEIAALDEQLTRIGFDSLSELSSRLSLLPLRVST